MKHGEYQILETGNCIELFYLSEKVIRLDVPDPVIQWIEVINYSGETLAACIDRPRSSLYPSPFCGLISIYDIKFIT